MKILPESTPLEEAEAALKVACKNFNNVALSTTPPGKLQMSVRELMCAVDHFAELKRETVRGVA